MQEQLRGSCQKQRDKKQKNFITVPMQGNKVRFGAGLGKFRRNLVMFRGSILRLCRTQKQPETFKNAGGWGGVWRTT